MSGQMPETELRLEGDLSGKGPRVLRVSLEGPVPLRGLLLSLGLDPARVGPALREGRSVMGSPVVSPGEHWILLPPLDGG